jgi:hypothetical protein
MSIDRFINFLFLCRFAFKKNAAITKSNIAQKEAKIEPFSNLLNKDCFSYFK